MDKVRCVVYLQVTGEVLRRVVVAFKEVLHDPEELCNCGLGASPCALTRIHGRM
jgi:hypothetical protein